MVGGRLQPLAGESPVNIRGRLFRRQVRAGRVRGEAFGRPAEEFGAQGEERGVAFARAFDATAACLTFVQMVTDRQQLRDLQLLSSVTLELSLVKMFDQVSSKPTAALRAALLTRLS